MVIGYLFKDTIYSEANKQPKINQKQHLKSQEKVLSAQKQPLTSYENSKIFLLSLTAIKTNTVQQMKFYIN